MSANIRSRLLNARLVLDGTDYPIHEVDWFNMRGRTSITARASIPTAALSSEECGAMDPVEQAARRQSLIDFAKTGAPPVSPYGFTSVPPALMAEGNVSDHAWVDNSPSYSAVLKARDEKAPARSVPRMVDQRPWVARRTAHRLRQEERLVAEKTLTKSDCEGCAESICAYCCATDQAFGHSNIEIKMVRPVSLNDFATEVHRDNQHWWHDPATGEKLDRNMGEMLMLVVSELAEAMEGERKGLMDDHLPTRKMAEVEMADAYIRLLDIAGSKRTEIDKYSFHDPVSFASKNKGEQLLRISNAVHGLRYKGTPSFDEQFHWTLKLIEMYCATHDYDLWGAIADKREYNKHRADHKPKARLAANGKKF